MKPISARAFARAGLLGNPSDGYGGQAIALTLSNFAARVELRPADRLALGSEPDGAALVELVRAPECPVTGDGERLLWAALHRLSVHWPALTEVAPDDPRLCFEMRYATDIPRQVGMSGSSAIVIAALRALVTWFDVRVSLDELAVLALDAEVEDLDIAAGPMDRVIQSHEGLLHMDFAAPAGTTDHRRLQVALLPPLFVAWQPAPGEKSSVVHGDLRTRWLRGDADMLEAVATLRGLVDEGLACLERRDVEGFQRCVDANFEARAAICAIADSDRELVRIGRSCGAAVKFCGSGGSVVGVMRDAGEFAAIEAAYRRAGVPSAAVSAETRS